MKLIFTHWEFEDDRLMLQVNVRGEGDRNAESHLILDALRITQKAKKYNGLVVQPWQFPEELNSDVTLTFKILFKTREDIDRYIEYIKSSNGM